MSRQTSPANRLGLDYRQPLERAWQGPPLVDIHTHVHDTPNNALFIEAADHFGIGPIFSMTPLAELPAIRALLGERVHFIAIPNWKQLAEFGSAFVGQWAADVRAFAGHGARICKLWMAPRIRERVPGMSARDDRIRAVIDAAGECGMDMMIHAGDPTVWWAAGKPYADVAKYGTKAAQYEQVEWLAEAIAPRRLIGAHMGGTLEDLAFLQGLLDRHANYYIDTSATKWIVREVARQPEAVAAFVGRNAGRVLFGSDLVTADKFAEFDHYASRYWCQRMMWESDYRGESPIEDPDSDPPQLAGLALPAEVLAQIYGGNARRLGWVR